MKLWTACRLVQVTLSTCSKSAKIMHTNYSKSNVHRLTSLLHEAILSLEFVFKNELHIFVTLGEIVGTDEDGKQIKTEALSLKWYLLYSKCAQYFVQVKVSSYISNGMKNYHSFILFWLQNATKNCCLKWDWNTHLPIVQWAGAKLGGVEYSYIYVLPD